jgi:hypothetical protein
MQLSRKIGAAVVVPRAVIGAEPEGRAQVNHAVVGWYPKVGRCGRRVVPEGRPMRSSGGTRRSADAVVGWYPKVGQCAYRGTTRRSSTKKPPLVLPYFCLASR